MPPAATCPRGDHDAPHVWKYIGEPGRAKQACRSSEVGVESEWWMVGDRSQRSEIRTVSKREEGRANDG